MASSPMETSHPEYRVWALDDVIYGPVPLDSLRAWIRDERIHSGSWIFCERTRRWQQAGEVTGLRELFYVPESDATTAAADELRPALLRRVRVLSDLSEDQIAIFIQFGFLVHFPPFATIMKQGSAGDSLFLVIEGHVRQRIFVRDREILIGIQESGGQFGQISLFDRGPRITDAVSDTAVTLFKVEGESFREFCRLHPDIAIPVLLALGRTLAVRIRSDDKHLCEMVAMNR